MSLAPTGNPITPGLPPKPNSLPLSAVARQHSPVRAQTSRAKTSPGIGVGRIDGSCKRALTLNIGYWGIGRSLAEHQQQCYARTRTFPTSTQLLLGPYRRVLEPMTFRETRREVVWPQAGLVHEWIPCRLNQSFAPRGRGTSTCLARSLLHEGPFNLGRPSP